MLTDSVGIAAAPVFAAAFKRLIWVYTNVMIAQEDVGKVAARVMSVEPIDSVVLLLNAGSAAKLVTWTDSLVGQLRR
jgi:hypothetical protein